MSGLFDVTVAEARGYTATLADLDQLCVVIGCSSAGSGLSTFYLSGAAAIAGVGYGDGPDTLTQTIEQRQANGNGAKMPAAFYTTPVTTAGSYGTIDNSLVTGTALFAVDSTVAPYGTYEAWIKWYTGCTVGTTGGAYQWSLDGGRTYSNVTALGTATTITIPHSNVKFILTPSAANLTALYTKTTLLQTTLTGTGHFTIVSGGTPVHASADTAGDTALAAVPAATTPATLVTLFNACVTYLGTHGASAVFHAGADAPLATALALIPTATNVADVDLYLDNLIAAYNAHRINTSSVHGSADSTNTITAYVSVPGTLIAGDIAKVRTLAPQPSTADVDAAFVALANASIDFALVALEFPCNAAMAAHVTTGLDALLSRGKRVTALVRTRIPDAETSETDAAWNTSVTADLATYTDSRIFPRAAYELITDAMTSRQYLRSDFAQTVADVVRCPRSVWPNAPADQPMANVTLINSSGTTIGHDEGTRGASTGMSNDTLGNRLSCAMRLPDFQRRESVYWTVPWVLYESTERIRNLMVRRIANAMERTAVSAAISGLGASYSYNAADPNVSGSLPTLTEASRNAIQGVIFGRLSVDFAGDIDNADDGDVDTGLVQVSPIVVVTGGNLLTVSMTLAPKVKGYLLKLNPITFTVKE